MPHVMSITSDCSESTDNLARFVYDCSGYYFGVFPSNIPNKTLVLLLRRTMKSPTVPSFQVIGLEKLQVLDLSWNSINKLSNNTFKDMTSLLSLDIRGNFVLAPVVPDGLFNSLIKLRTLQVEGAQFTRESSKYFIEATKSLSMLNSFVFYGGDVKFGIYMASQLTNLTSLEFRMCFNPELFSLAQILHQLRNLTKLESITIVHCYLSNVGNISLDGLKNVRSINLGCNYLNIRETISFLGSQSALSQLDTLVMDRIDMTKNIFDCNEVLFNSNVFCNLSFSSSLRRLSIQQVQFLYYETTMFRCLHNLRSISIGHNMFIDILENGRIIEPEERLPVALRWSKSLYFIKISSIVTVATTKETFCHAEDNTFDQYFIDESQFQVESTVCEAGNSDLQHGYLKLPLCLRALQVDHSGYSSDDSGNLPPVSIHVLPNNTLELLDFSYSVFHVDGLFINALSFSGLHRLRILKLRHMNIKRFYMVTFAHADNLYDIDLSDNRLELMTGKQFSQMFTKSLSISKLNLSSCGIFTLNSDFLRQFPRITFLDLSNNKLSHLALNLSWLSSNGSLIMDLSSNQISTVNDSFVESVKQMELQRSLTLKLNNNQFRCDCDTITFLKWLQNTPSLIEKKNNITCDYRGVRIALIVSVNIDDLEFQCSKFMRILYISLGSVLSSAIMGITLGVLLFKYRWHIRWYWFRLKRRIQQKISEDAFSLISTEREFICYVSYIGVSFQWIMREMVSPLEESLNSGNVFIFARNSEPGVPVIDVIMNAINSSRKLLYVVGTENNVGEREWFYFSLKLAMVERLEDIIIVYKDVTVCEIFQQRIPLLRPNRRSPIRHVQYEANDMFWPEIQQHLNSFGQEYGQEETER